MENLTLQMTYRAVPMNEPDGMENGWWPCAPSDATLWFVESDDELVMSFVWQADAEAYAAELNADARA